MVNLMFEPKNRFKRKSLKVIFRKFLLYNLFIRTEFDSYKQF